MYRVLRPGGIFIAAREHVISKEADLGSSSSMSIRCITYMAASMRFFSIAISVR